MRPKGGEPSLSLSIGVKVREVSASDAPRDLRKRQIAAVGRLLRRAVLISKHGDASASNGSPPKASGRRKRR